MAFRLVVGLFDAFIQWLKSMTFSEQHFNVTRFQDRYHRAHGMQKPKPSAVTAHGIEHKRPR